MVFLFLIDIVLYTKGEMLMSILGYIVKKVREAIQIVQCILELCFKGEMHITKEDAEELIKWIMEYDE